MERARHPRSAESRTQRRSTTAAAVLAVLLTLASLGVLASGCGSDATDGDGPATSEVGVRGELIAHPDRIPVLIREHLGKNPEIRRLSISANGFTVQVRDPAKPDNLDDYGYADGEWTTRPVAVSVSEIAQYEAVTFWLRDIAWERIPDLVDQALAGLDLEGEEIGGVSFDRLAGERPRVFISINGLRGSGRLLANADGTDVDIQRN